LETCPTIALYSGAKLPELAVEPFVAPVEITDGVDRRFTLRGQSSEDQSRASAQIGRHYGRSAQARYTVNDCRVALHRNTRAEPIEFGRMEESIIEYGVANAAHAVGERD
jgi:galactose mutarotase-like enzyme